MASGKMEMPIQVRAFWWISVAIVLYSIVLTVLAVQYLQHQEFLPIAPRIPRELRERTYEMDVLVRVASTVVRSSLILCLAWLTAFRRLKWARWAFVLFFLIQWAFEIWEAIEFHQFNGPVSALIKEGWWEYIFIMLVIAAASCVFSSGTRKWFERSQ